MYDLAISGWRLAGSRWREARRGRDEVERSGGEKADDRGDLALAVGHETVLERLQSSCEARAG